MGGNIVADIYHQFPINAPLRQVFEAISTPDGLDSWWTLRAAGIPSEGEEYEFWFGSEADWRAVVSVYVPEESLEFTMTEAQQDWMGTRVGFGIDEKDGVTNVRFYHTGWPRANEHFQESSYCWAMYLRLLKRYVERGEVVPYSERPEA